MRAGVLVYQKDGKPWRELRPPAENVKATESLRSAPLTDGHPPDPITADNVKQYLVGTVADCRVEDDWTVARLAIHDGKALDSGRRSLLAGYSCVLAPPDPELAKVYGEHDAVQTDIAINHLALVDAGRAGPDAIARLDGADNEIETTDITLDSKEEPPTMTTPSTTTTKIAIDGKSYEVPPEVKAHIDALEGAAAAVAVREDSARQRGIEINKKIERRAEERAALYLIGADVGVPREDMVGVADATLRRRFTEKLAPRLDLENKSDAWIAAALEALLTQRPNPIDAVRSAAFPFGPHNMPDGYGAAMPDAAGAMRRHDERLLGGQALAADPRDARADRPKDPEAARQALIRRLADHQRAAQKGKAK